MVDHHQDLFLGQGPGTRSHSEKLEQIIDDETALEPINWTP
jgi:hypothetical protein